MVRALVDTNAAETFGACIKAEIAPGLLGSYVGWDDIGAIIRFVMRPFLWRRGPWPATNFMLAEMPGSGGILLKRLLSGWRSAPADERRLYISLLPAICLAGRGSDQSCAGRCGTPKRLAARRCAAVGERRKPARDALPSVGCIGRSALRMPMNGRHKPFWVLYNDRVTSRTQLVCGCNG